MSDKNILYSFRRCPYAMRARMALSYAGIDTDIIEVDFKDKPKHMLEVSPKGTVPVLCLKDGTVIDESLDIMQWALTQNDPDSWAYSDLSLVEENDGSFKKALDLYKYPDRYPGEDTTSARIDGEMFLFKLEGHLQHQDYLSGDHLSIVDVAVFPFIRQFAHVDKDWFYSLELPCLHAWFKALCEGKLYTQIMEKDLSNIPPLAA